jgi:predicted nucleic acid-binding protein
MRSFFDTNILVYLFDHDAPGKQHRAQQALQDEVSGG